jgi:hypothetical protein
MGLLVGKNAHYLDTAMDGIGESAIESMFVFRPVTITFRERRRGGAMFRGGCDVAVDTRDNSYVVLCVAWEMAVLFRTLSYRFSSLCSFGFNIS